MGGKSSEPSSEKKWVLKNVEGFGLCPPSNLKRERTRPEGETNTKEEGGLKLPYFG